LEPDSLGWLELGQMRTISSRWAAPINAQIVDRSNVLLMPAHPTVITSVAGDRDQKVNENNNDALSVSPA
jgi:hypothetical protein